jgi:hypothetical protein
MRMYQRAQAAVRVCQRCNREVSERRHGALFGWASTDGELVCANAQTPHFVPVRALAR